MDKTLEYLPYCCPEADVSEAVSMEILCFSIGTADTESFGEDEIQWP